MLLVTSVFTVAGRLADDATPTPDPTYNPDLVTPGIIGFVITLAVAVAAVLLIIDMVRRIRRVNLRQQAKEKVDAEVAAAAASASKGRGRGAGSKKLGPGSDGTVPGAFPGDE